MIKQMIQKIQYWAMLLLVLALGSCTDDLDTGRSGVIDENGMVRLNIQTQVPGLKLTRSIDVNGEAITTLWLVAFNENGNMISRVQATLSNNNVVADGGSANFTASVPSSTRILHLLANVNMDNFVDADYIGRHENEVIAPMVSSSGNLVYWGRKTFTSKDDLTAFANNPTAITLYRNQAQIKYNVTGSGLDVLGWAACNQYAYGTVAPFDASAIGVEGDNPFHFSLEENDKVTTLPEAYNVKATDPRQVNQNEADGDPRYVFETSNPENDQLYIIMLIKKDEVSKYYKIMLVDDNKIPYQIIRNHQYIINISDVNASFGVDKFEDAKNAVPANNPWITVDDVIPEVINGNTTLRIEGQTTVVYQEEGEKNIDFYYNGGKDGLEIKWISNPGVATGEPGVSWTDDSNGKITLNVPEPPANGILEGTLSIREKEGPLSRRVKVVLCQPFKFSPVWISSEIPLVENENIAVLFEIPDDYPQELLPVKVKFGCDLIDAQKGENLAVVSEKTSYRVPKYSSEDGKWTIEEVTPDWNYKYVYTADCTGKHRVDFRMILANIEGGSDESGINTDEEFHIYMEGCAAATNQKLFEQRDLFFAFQPKSNPHYRIMLGESGVNSTTRFATYAVEGLDPVYGQDFSVPFTLGTLNNDGSTDGKNSWNDVKPYLEPYTKLWVYYDPNLVSFLGDDGVKVNKVNTDHYGNTYSEYIPSDASGELKFRTIRPNFDCDIVISAKSIDSYGQFDGGDNPYLGINKTGYRSAAISVKSSGSLDFNPTFSNDGLDFGSATNEEWQLPYGTKRDFYLKIEIPGPARGKAFQFHLKTSNLTPVDMSDDHGTWTAMDEAEGKGWIYTFKDGLSLDGKTFHFQTNRLAVTETLTMSSGNYVGFNPVSVNLSNTPLEGTLTLPDGVKFGVNSPFVILERKDGTRIGVFTLPSDDLTNEGSTAYSLTLRGEYNLTENDEVTVKWSPVGSPDMYSHTYSHLSEIMQDNLQINLIRQ
ncbi:hypothetical protein [Phocaeicola plebeius]|uniref:hypothetical protein n=1 Tax=Phocaeicola plebeius TaxID=310297 RepID=UPI0026EBBD0F|nr:hypothetical protein [Phocaeicola plebeius]